MVSNSESKDTSRDVRLFAVRSVLSVPPLPACLCVLLVPGKRDFLRTTTDISLRGIMNFEKMPDQEIWDIANPIMNNLMDASTEINHERHIKDFTDRMKRIVTPEYLQDVCKRYQSEKGYFSERVPVALFKRPDSAVIIWKQSFTKAQGEFVAEMVLVNEQGTYRVDHVMVF